MTTAGPIADCLAGRLSPEVALARLLLAGGDAGSIEAAIRDLPGDAGAALRGVFAMQRGRLDALAGEVRDTAAAHSAAGDTPAEGVAAIAAFFDRAVRHSPEASVALYSLGDPAILAAATAEIVGWLGERGLVGAGSDVLDLGCGIGRVAGALAPLCRSVLAVDVSEGMVAEAGARLAALAHVQVRRTTGTDLDWLEPDAFDLILAVDSFPYVIQAGAALTHVQGAARALRSGGHLCILNLSYRGDAEADRADVAAWSAATGMRVVLEGVRPFRLWDGNATLLAK